MKIIEPIFRCGTGEAILELSHELKLPYDKTMQDWSYEVSNPNDIEKYLNHYNLLNNDDKKFVLMEIIIEAVTNQLNHKKLNQYWEQTKNYLLRDQSIHKYTIFYWCCFDNNDLDDCWNVAPYMRKLWFEIEDTKWKPISLSEVKKIIKKGIICMSEKQLIIWKKTAIIPEKWTEKEFGKEGGGFWVVARSKNKVIWYNDIEEGFNISTFSIHGEIDEYKANQDELQWTIEKL